MRAANEGAPVVVPCTQGVNQSSHPRLSPLGTFDTVQNMRISAAGLMRKRPGTRAIGGTTMTNVSPAFTADGSTNTPSFISTYGQTGVIGSSSGELYIHQEVDDSLVPMGRFSSCQPIRRRSDIVGFASGQTALPADYAHRPPSVAVNSDGYVAYLAVSDAEDLYLAIETPAGARIATKFDLTTVSRAKIVAVGTVFYLVWIRGTTTLVVMSITIGTGSVTFGTTTTIETDVITDSRLDACALTASTWAIAYQSSAGSNALTLLRMSGVTVATTATIVTSTNPAEFSIHSNLTNLWVGWVDSTDDPTYAVYRASDFAVVLAATEITTAGTGVTPPYFCDGSSATQAIAIFNSTVTTGGFRLFGCTLTTAGVVDFFTFGMYGAKIVSKPDSSVRFWAIVGESEVTGLCRLCLLRMRPESTANLIAVELSLDEMPGNPDLVDLDYFGAIAIAGDGRCFFAFPFVLSVNHGEPLSRVDLLEYSTTELEPARSVVRANSSLFIAGQPVEVMALPLGVIHWDGTLIQNYGASGSAELGFVSGPSEMTITESGSGPLPAGTYVYYFVYEWIDQRGQRQQSPPTPPLTVTKGNGTSITATWMPCEITQRQSIYGPTTRPWIVAYRTLVNGTTAHRLPQVEPRASGSFDLNQSDADISDEEILYTQGGVLANTLAPSCRFIRYASGRLWCGGLWQSDLLEASKLIVPDEQPAFTNDATHRISIGGPCTGLAVMDDQLVAFLEDSIVAISGDGPNDQGAGGSFAVRSISAGVGCVDEQSILETDLGILFRSRLGFHILPRGFGPPQYIGMAVKDTATSFPTTLGSAVWQGNEQYLARFLVTSDSDWRVLSYELNSGQWFVDTYADEMAAIGVWSEGFVLCKADLDDTDGALANQPIWIEDPDEVADGVWASTTGHHIEQRWRTNWITPAGPGGWTEAKQILFAVVASASASVSFMFEADGTSSSHSNSWSFSSSTDVAYRYLVPLERHCVGFRLSAWDAAVSSVPTEGVTFIAATVENDPDVGMRLPDDGERV